MRFMIMAEGFDTFVTVLYATSSKVRMLSLASSLLFFVDIEAIEDEMMGRFRKAIGSLNRIGLRTERPLCLSLSRVGVLPLH
jgi:hypothetical protein